MQMDHDEAHLRIVDGALRGRAPGYISASIKNEKTNDHDLRKIFELKT